MLQLVAVGTSESLSEAIVRQVAGYEKRLLNPRVTVETETREVITLRFELAGDIEPEQEGDAPQPFAMVVRINSSGQIFIEPKTER
ncbi:MAG: hypothetical protein WDA26_15170 [Pusillimonas sp.]